MPTGRDHKHTNNGKSASSSDTDKSACTQVLRKKVMCFKMRVIFYYVISSHVTSVF